MKKYNEINKDVIEGIDFLIITLEGGYDKITDDPHDVGGLTKGGIAQRYYPNLDIRNLTREDIIEIAYNDYYSKYERLPIKVRHFVYWTGFNIGNGFIRPMVQEVINEWFDMIRKAPDSIQVPKNLVVDGILGNNTANGINFVLEYIKRYDRHNFERIFIYSMYDKIVARYKTRPTAWKHLPGWLNRIDRQFKALNI